MSDQPVLPDIPFDHAAATAAADECDSMAALLRDTVAQRTRAADRARYQWEGRQRREFDVAVSTLRERSDSLEAELRRLAGQIRASAAAAAAEQARRDMGREQSEREHALEAAVAARRGQHADNRTAR